MKKLSILALSGLMLAMAGVATEAQARGGFSSSRSSSFSRPSAPRPATKVTNVRNVTVNRTTVVQQHSSGGGGGMGMGGGIVSSMVGSFAGSSLANWWSNSSNEEKAAQAKAEEEQKLRDEQAAANELRLNMLLQQQAQHPLQIPGQ